VRPWLLLLPSFFLLRLFPSTGYRQFCLVIGSAHLFRIRHDPGFEWYPICPTLNILSPPLYSSPLAFLAFGREIFSGDLCLNLVT